MKIEHKIFESEVKAFDDENLIVEHFISTEHKDRGGDIMRAKGMKIVGKPVVLLLHGRGSMGSEPVAKPLSITVDEFKGQPGVLARTQFYPDETGRRLYGKSKGGFFPSWSIGYAVDEAKDIFEAGKYAGRDVTKWQLLEYSLVGVPMNPFAQTVKEFLDADDAGKRPEIKEDSRWFGIVDEKTCTGCGSCPDCKKPGECPTCKAALVLYALNGKTVLLPCEKCQPEEHATEELAAEIAFAACHPDTKENSRCWTCGDGLWVKWGRTDEKSPYQKVKAYCPKGCEIVNTPDGGFMLQLGTLKEFIEGVRETFKDVPEKLKLLDEKFAKLEPLLKTLPPEPEGGKEGEEEHHDNPPEEKKTPPRLVIVREEETPEAKQQAQRARVLAIAREVLNDAAKQEIDRMKGRVP